MKIDLESFRDDANKLNSVFKTLQKDKDTLYQEFADSVREVFEELGMPVKGKIQVAFNCSVAKVYLKQDTKDRIDFPKNFGSEIGIPYSVCRTITPMGDQELYIELYPLDE